jgi:hypothetical protein
MPALGRQYPTRAFLPSRDVPRGRTGPQFLPEPSGRSGLAMVLRCCGRRCCCGSVRGRAVPAGASVGASASRPDHRKLCARTWRAEAALSCHIHARRRCRKGAAHVQRVARARAVRPLTGAAALLLFLRRNDGLGGCQPAVARGARPIGARRPPPSAARRAPAPALPARLTVCGAAVRPARGCTRCAAALERGRERARGCASRLAFLGRPDASRATILGTG